MADSRVADLTELAAPASDDLLYVVDVSAVAPRDRRITLANLRADNVDSVGIATSRTLVAVTGALATPVELLDADGGRISLLEYGGSIIALTFSALFSAGSLIGESAGYKIEGVIRVSGATREAVGPFFTTTLAEDTDWSVVASVSGDDLVFHFTGTLGVDISITGHVQLVYTIAEV